MKLGELRGLAAGKLAGTTEDRPFYAVDLLLAKALGTERVSLVTRHGEEIPQKICEFVLSMTERRAKGEPLSYILGEAEFYGRCFFVGEGVLIPRPETELLVEAMLGYITDGAIFADWCTGSGCIGISLLLETKNTHCVGIDANLAALGWASQNIELHSLNDRFTLVHNAEPAQAGFSDESFDFVVANPPYIPSEEIAGLMCDVKDYEPLDALDGGKDGISLYKKFFGEFPRILKPGGYFGVEIAGDAQAEKILKIAPNSLILEQKIYDYNNILRHLIWKKHCGINQESKIEFKAKIPKHD